MKDSLQILLEGIHDRRPVSGFTHQYYRYPARFSPRFVRAVIEAFTSPGDVVLDPFAGGGTTLVEAAALGRNPIGVDLNSLGVFVSRVKTTLLSKDDRDALTDWKELVVPKLLLKSAPKSGSDSPQEYPTQYTRNLHTVETWRIRRLIQLALGKLELLSSEAQRNFARCSLLKTAQWALDCRRVLPSADEFRSKLALNLDEMIAGNVELMRAYMRSTGAWKRYLASCFNRSTTGLEHDSKIAVLERPRLILTSPPYPGVHVLYHRWQIMSRRETPAPYWIANCLDGKGASFYNFGDRFETDLTTYYEQTQSAFQSIKRIASKSTLIVQLVAFSNPAQQLERYLEVMSACGLRETKFTEMTNSPDGRIWRTVPNRKWYATPTFASSNEVVLFHAPI